jgi:hypothetical protein
MHTKTVWLVAALAAALPALGAGAALAAPKVAAPKFYFRLHEVKAGPEVDPALKAYAGEALQAELASRPEWASDIGATDPDALVAELKKRNLRGFSVTVRFEHDTKELKEPSPGARRKRLALDIALAVFGTTIPEEKLAFSGDGESSIETEVSDQGTGAETASIAKDVIKVAVKQAVDEAVAKLSEPATPNGKHAKHGKKK